MSEPWPVERVGSTGEDVRTVQHLLNAHGESLTVDGRFGSATEAAVKRFQSAHGLTPDGIVGAQTWPALLLPVAPGESGSKVRAVQGQLAGQGWRLAVDGAFGPQTARSVRDFRTAHGLPSGDTVDATLWNVLVGGFAPSASPTAASGALFDAWGADDRKAALRAATQSAVDLLLRGERGTLTAQGCAADDVLGAGRFVCSYSFEGGGVTMHVVGDDVDGYYVESTEFFVD